MIYLMVRVVSNLEIKELLPSSPHFISCDYSDTVFCISLDDLSVSEDGVKCLEILKCSRNGMEILTKVSCAMKA